MELNEKQQRLVQIYKQLYQYRHLLKGAPELTIDLSALNEDAVAEAFDGVNDQLKAEVSYLLGIRGADLPVSMMLDAVEKHYKKDDFWRRLLLDYIEIIQEQEEQGLTEKKQDAQNEGLSLYEKLMDFQRRRKEIVESFVKKIEPESFPIDSRRLFKNYLNMADLDAEQAWNVLIDNPAAFSPIIVEDSHGKRILSVAAAKEVNKKIGAFVKKMKA